jgi:hypothetical protein
MHFFEIKCPTVSSPWFGVFVRSLKATLDRLHTDGSFKAIVPAQAGGQATLVKIRVSCNRVLGLFPSTACAISKGRSTF